MLSLILKAVPWASQLLKTASVPLVTFTIGALLAGYYVADNYELKLKEQALKMAQERAEQGKKAHEKIISITNELDRSRASSVDLRAELDRVRVAYAKRTATANARKLESAPDPRGAELLERGAGLVAECSRLLRDHALKHDALSKAVSN